MGAGGIVGRALAPDRSVDLRGSRRGRRWWPRWSCAPSIPTRTDGSLRRRGDGHRGAGPGRGRGDRPGRPGDPVGAILAVLGLLPALDVLSASWASAAVSGEAAGAGSAVLLYRIRLDPPSEPRPAVAALPDGRPLTRAGVRPRLSRSGRPGRRRRQRPSRSSSSRPHVAVARPMPLLSSPASTSSMSSALIALTAALAIAAIAMILRFAVARRGADPR